jgi:hypothetical protein
MLAKITGKTKDQMILWIDNCRNRDPLAGKDREERNKNHAPRLRGIRRKI